MGPPTQEAGHSHQCKVIENLEDADAGVRICDRAALPYLPERECKNRSREKHNRNDKATDTVFRWRDFHGRKRRAVKVSIGQRVR